MLTPKSRPVLRYHGGKYKLAPNIVSLFPRHRCYVEAFGGGGSVLMAKPPSPVEIYNDIGDSVVNYFRVLRDPDLASDLHRLLELTPFSRTEFKACYPVQHENPVEWARRFVVISFQGFGTKKENEMNGWRSPTLLSGCNPARTWHGYAKMIPIFTERLKSVAIESKDAFGLFDLYDAPDTLWYLDPPYVLNTRSCRYRDVYHNELTDEDHVRLLAKAIALKGFVVISGYDSEIYDRHLAGWTRFDFDARTQTNTPRTECLWVSPRISRQDQKALF